MRWTARWLGRMGIVSAACALIGAGGCAAPRDTTFRSPPGRYAEAFEAARASLREAGFEVERADARLGVITTAPLHEAGLFTPWAGIGDSVGEAWEDTLNDRWRRAEIRFAPAEETIAFEDAAPRARDLREGLGALSGGVRVRVQQVHRPGLQVQAASARLSSFARDPALLERGLQPLYLTDDGDDPGLAARIAADIRRRLESRDTSEGAKASASGDGEGRR